MADFNVRSDSVNVEQIMEQIRARIREKRGVDYTEQQIRELAAVKLEKFLDPRGVRSDLLEQFRKAQPAYAPPDLPNYAFEDRTLYESTRPVLRWIRRLLNPILKLFFNPNPLIQALNIQSRLNSMYSDREARREATRRAFDQLQYELMHNLVIETTRMSIEVKNLKMRVESLASRLEFNERRARALESVVVYNPSAEDRIEQAPAGALRESRLSPRFESSQRDREPDRRDQGRGSGFPGGQDSPSRPGQRVPTAPAQAPATVAAIAPPQSAPGGTTPQGPPEGPGQRSRRRRRRRGRRGGGSAAAIMGGTPQPPEGGTDSGSSDTSLDADNDAATDASDAHEEFGAQTESGSESIQESHEGGVNGHDDSTKIKGDPPGPSDPQ